MGGAGEGVNGAAPEGQLGVEGAHTPYHELPGGDHLDPTIWEGREREE